MMLASSTVTHCVTKLWFPEHDASQSPDVNPTRPFGIWWNRGFAFRTCSQQIFSSCAMLTRQYGPKSLLLNVKFFQHLNESVTLRIKAALKVERSKEELMKYPVPCSIQMRTATNISFLHRLNDSGVWSPCHTGFYGANSKGSWKKNVYHQLKWDWWGRTHHTSRYNC